MTQARILQGDSLEVLKTLPSDSVHCIVTSPPYWGGLRDYGVDGQLGLEPTPEEHIERIVEIFREARRVLHPSGTLWFNYGDCWATHAGSARVPGGNNSYQAELVENGAFPKQQPNRMPQRGLKKKDLVGMPWMCAFALRADGWYLRADIIWHKTNGKPSSVTDRPAPVHEYIFLLTKKPHYFYDQEAARELTGNESSWDDYAAADADHSKSLTHPLGRNKRSLWSMATEPFSYKQIDPDYAGDDHFATFPTELAQAAIKAGTSEKGCCPVCFNPWVREYEVLVVQQDSGQRKIADAPGAKLSEKSMMRTGRKKLKKPIGWKPSCKHKEEPIPCTVLDPFSGAGTSGVVSLRLFRDYIGIELNPKDVEMSARRIKQDRPLFNRLLVTTIG